jgi:hypothetical protein
MQRLLEQIPRDPSEQVHAVPIPKQKKLLQMPAALAPPEPVERLLAKGWAPVAQRAASGSAADAGVATGAAAAHAAPALRKGAGAGFAAAEETRHRAKRRPRDIDFHAFTYHPPSR